MGEAQDAAEAVARLEEALGRIAAAAEGRQQPPWPSSVRNEIVARLDVLIAQMREMLSAGKPD